MYMNVDCSRTEKCLLLSRDNDAKKTHYCPIEVIIFTVLLSACIALLIFIESSSGYYFTQFPENNEKAIIKNPKKKDVKGLFSKFVPSQKKDDNDECERTLALKRKSTDANKPIFWDGSVYFIKDDGIITDQEACALESILYKYPNHTHLIELLCNRPKELIQGTDFIKLLQNNYKNFQATSIKGNDFFKNTPVEGNWKCDDNIALFQGKVLTLWLYGGAVMSFDVLFNTPDILNYDGLQLSPYVMMSKDERLRLILIEQDDYDQNPRTTGIAHGAATVFAKWPSYIASAIWLIVFIVSLVTLIMLITFMSLLNQGKIVEQSLYIPSEESHLTTGKDIKSEFCNQMIDKAHEKRQSIPEKDLEVFDSGNNIFYMVLKPLDKYSACSIESVLRSSPTKNIFLMFLKNLQQSFENALRVNYENFNIINIEGKTITRGSPFEGKWKADDRSLYEVALLTVWQFGGTVLSEDLLMLNNRLYDEDAINCQIDPELIYCPQQCAAYLYDLIGETLRQNRNSSMDNLIDSSIMKFCGSEHFIQTGCKGVTRIDGMDMCSMPEDRCMFVRIREWINIAKSMNDTIWKEMGNYCPTTQKYQNTVDRQVIGEEQTETSISKTQGSTPPFDSTTPSKEQDYNNTTITSTGIETLNYSSQTTTDSSPSG
ncbi:uncharacterized protein [Halyomorpha halys]|uniref:uncharacterized protein n=1 Tax=Halyomorpha halys TaxID=286706 RepID=UPI0006D5295E|nr:uncharacterized protein LOC106684152 [Halyomorpha halys]